MSSLVYIERNLLIPSSKPRGDASIAREWWGIRWLGLGGSSASNAVAVHSCRLIAWVQTAGGLIFVDTEPGSVSRNTLHQTAVEL